MPSSRTHRICRACGGYLEPTPILQYAGMPAGAQDLPSLHTVAHDKSIDLELFLCSCCGVVQLANRPVPYWRTVIRASGFSRAMMAFRTRQFRSFVQRYGLMNARGIEIGCGDGSYLSLLSRAGMRMTGIEYSGHNVRVCRQKGLEVLKGFVRHGKPVNNDGFNAFFVFSYMEHVPVLRDFLGGIKSNLREGAVGLVEVPNFDMILRHGLFAEFIIDHLFYFSKETFVRTLQNNGFDILSCKAIWHKYILSAEVRKRPQLDASSLREAENSVIQSFVDFMARHKRVAVWGAGHQSFTLLALLKKNVSDIVYIVDSASFKQGCFSPVTHIPIFDPSILSKEPVDALIVIGGGYSNEIAKIAKGQYHQKNIVIFKDNGFEPYS